MGIKSVNDGEIITRFSWVWAKRHGQWDPFIFFAKSNSMRQLNTPTTCDVAIQTDIPPPYVLASGENTTGCFDIHTPRKPVEDYFVALHDALQHLVTTLALYDGNCPLWGFTIDMQSLTVRQHGHAARTDKHLLHRWSLCSMVFDSIAGKFTANLRFCTYILFPFLNFMLF